MSVQIEVPIIVVKPNQWIKEGDRMLFYSCIEDGEALCLNKTGGTVYLDLKTRVTISKNFNKGILKESCQDYDRCNCLVDCKTGYQK